MTTSAPHEPTSGWQAQAEALATTLAHWPIADDDHQRQVHQRFCQVLAREGVNALIKGVLPAHFTASLIVFNPSLTRVLLTHHRKARRWFQFGGHLELGDRSVEETARREGSEESGLTIEGPLVACELDAHTLSSAFGHCREHLDLRFTTTVPDGARAQVSAESLDVAWFAIDEIPDPRPEVSRAIARARQLLAQG